MSQKPASAGKIIGITCGSIFAAFILLPLLSFSLFMGEFPMSGLFGPLLIAGVIVFVVVRSRRLRAEANDQDVAIPTSTHTPVQATQVATQGKYATTVCQHSFTDQQLAGKATITCPCGFKFKVKDLVDFESAQKEFIAIEAKVAKARQRLYSATLVQTKAVSEQKTPTTSPAVAPKPNRSRPTLTLQQWLIIGASAIIVLAGSVFVSANLNTLSSEGFLGVTIGISVVTAALAVWGRRFSVMLANFMANFSSVMLMFALLVLGDIFYVFTWDTAPAWWWTLDLLFVAVVSLLLSRFTANFGWKLVTLVSITAAAIIICFGELRTTFPDGSASFAWFSAALLGFALLLAFASRIISSFKTNLIKLTSDLEYEKDLVQREKATLEKFTLWSLSAIGAISIGYLVINLLVRVGEPPEPLSFTVLSLAGIVAFTTRKLWRTALVSSENSYLRLSSFLSVFAFTLVALAFSAMTQYLAGDNDWLGIVGMAVLLFAVVTAGVYVKPLALHPLAVQVAHYSLAGSWLIWFEFSESTLTNTFAAVGVVILSLALSLAYQSWLGSAKAILPSVILGFFGVSNLVWSLKTNSEIEVTSVSYALVAIAIVVSSALFAPIAALTFRKYKSEQGGAIQQLVLWLTAVQIIVLSIPPLFASLPGQLTNLSSVFVVGALVTGSVSRLKSVKVNALDKLLISYSFVFQGGTLFALLVSSRSEDQLELVGLAFIGLSAMNYLLAYISKTKTTVIPGYVYSLVGLFILSWTQRDVWLISVHITLAVIAALALNVAVKFVSRRTGSYLSGYLALGSIFIFTIQSLVANYGDWTNGANSTDVLVGSVLFVLIAIVSTLLAELNRFNVGNFSVGLRVTALTYMLLGFVTMASFPLDSDLTQHFGQDNLVGYRRILLATVFAIISFRQLKLSSKSRSSETIGWFALGYLAPVTIAFIAGDLVSSEIYFGDFELEVFTLPLALALAIPPLFNGVLSKNVRTTLSMDVPIMFPAVVSAIYGLTQDFNDEVNLYRLVVSTLVIAGYSQWKLSIARHLAWGIASYLGLVGLALSTSQLVEVVAPEVWDGPELFGILSSAAVLLGNRNLMNFVKFKSTLITHGLPLIVLMIPSLIQSYTTLDISLQLTNPVQITRILIVLTIALASLVFGIRAGNLGIAVAGGASLTMLVLPITWVSSSGANDIDTTFALRGFAVAAFLFLLLGGLRSIHRIPDSSYLYLGIPTVVALGPSLYLTILSIGDTTMTQVDWWRFGITVGASLTLLVIGALRSLGGLFFPGLVGLALGVLPYAFQPVARESWFLWVVLLVIASVMVWIAIRLEQIRKLGKTSASWIKALR